MSAHGNSLLCAHTEVTLRGGPLEDRVRGLLPVPSTVLAQRSAQVTLL